MSTTEDLKAATKSAWVKAKLHTVNLPSGVVVDIQIPNLPLLIRTGQIPNNLIDAALEATQREEKITREIVAQQSEFYHKLISLMVVAPSITEEDVADLPYEDVELLAEIGTRQRDLDALGRHIGGLHKSKEWRAFRGLDFFDEDVEGL